MTVPPTRDELLELAELDALGALEAPEQARFERGLRDASPALRAELQAVQDRVVMDPLGTATPEELPAGLKYQVMARIAEAVRETEAELAPIASIGGPARPMVVAPVAAMNPGQLPVASPATDDTDAARDADVLARVAQAAHANELERVRALLDRARSHGYLLRAACIALAACLVVAGFALVRQDAYAKQVTLAAISASSREELKALLGPGIEAFLRDGVPCTALTGTGSSATGGVVVWADPINHTAFVALIGLDPTRSFELTSRLDGEESSKAAVVAAGVQSHGPISGMLLEGLDGLPGRVMELRDPGTGTVLYRGQLR